MYVYHVFGPMDQEDDLYKALKEGLNHTTRSSWCTDGVGGL
ncbi:hypothetical protein [Salibacterium aidingense]